MRPLLPMLRSITRWPISYKSTDRRRREPRFPVPEEGDDAGYGRRLCGRRIRLLRLLPQATPESLIYEMGEYELDSQVEFEALSYSWGDPTPNCPIICNGQEVKIAQNLHDALQQFQKDGGRDLLLVSAIELHDNVQADPSGSFCIIRY